MYSVPALHAKDPMIDSCQPHHYCQGLGAQSCNPATGEQGYWDGDANPGLYNLVEIEMASQVEWSWVCKIPQGPVTTWNWVIAQGSVGTRHRIWIRIQALNWKAPIAKAMISMLHTEGSQSDCILLAINGDIHAINAGSSHIHTIVVSMLSWRILNPIVVSMLSWRILNPVVSTFKIYCPIFITMLQDLSF